MAEGGFSYPVRVPGWCAAVIGLDPDGLPALGEAPVEKPVEITALGGERMTFEASPAENRRFVLTAEAVHDAAAVKINGEDAGTFLFRPYELDITAHVREGENTAALTFTPSPANTWGKPVPVGAEGLTVRVTERNS